MSASVEAALLAAKAKGLTSRALISVDLFGLSADYDALNAFCKTHDLLLIADAAQSFGATFRGRKVGTLAPITTTSFFPAKPLGCYGDGGALLTGDAELAATLKSLRVHGQGSDKYDNIRIGMNSPRAGQSGRTLTRELVSLQGAEQRDRSSSSCTNGGHWAAPYALWFCICFSTSSKIASKTF